MVMNLQKSMDSPLTVNYYYNTSKLIFYHHLHKQEVWIAPIKKYCF